MPRPATISAAPVRPSGDRLQLSAATSDGAALTHALDLARAISFSTTPPAFRDAKVRSLLAETLPKARHTAEALDIARSASFLITMPKERGPVFEQAIHRAIALGKNRRDLEHILTVVSFHGIDPKSRERLVGAALGREWPDGSDVSLPPFPSGRPPGHRD
ncbi:MAG: hypothetical protein VKO64_03775 [Candidatus Sericytochromatia bacterium]|nr:hypothetical protein [Candidatus Sericytochromatia bacterium]